MNIWDFGSTLTQEKMKAGNRIFTPGLYNGFIPTLLGPNQLKLSTGCLLSPKGVLHVPTTDTLVPDFPVVALPGSYTLQATHDDIQAIGGSVFRFRWVTGLQPRYDEAENAVSVLYVRQTTGGALAADQLSQPQLLQNGAIQAAALHMSIGPEFSLFSSATGPNVSSLTTTSLTQAQYLGLRSTNSALTGIQTHTFRLAVPAGIKPHSLGIQCELPSLGSIAFSGVAADGTAITLTPPNIAGPITDIATPIALDLSNNASPLVALLVVVTIPAGTSCFLHRVLLRVD